MYSFGRTFLWFFLICLRLAVVNIAGDPCKRYPLEDPHLESQGIYTGYRDPDKLLVFKVSEKSVLTVDSLPGSNETIFVRKTMSVRDTCPLYQKTLSPKLEELLKLKGEVCLTGPSQGTRDIYSLLGRKLMAVWTFTVPANQCFEIKFLIRIQQGRSDYYRHYDRLMILDGELVYPVMIKPGVSQFAFPLRNYTATVSVAYFYTSLSGRIVYWRVAPSLKTSNCLC